MTSATVLKMSVHKDTTVFLTQDIKQVVPRPLCPNQTNKYVQLIQTNTTHTHTYTHKTVVISAALSEGPVQRTPG